MAAVSILRAVRVVLASLIPVLVGVVACPPAHAQGVADLTLLSQTPWNSKPAPRSGDPNLVVTVVATNGGQARLGELSIAIVLGQRLESRFAYERSLLEGPVAGSTIVDVPFQEGLDSGKARTFQVSVDLSTLPGIVSQEDSAVYPAQIQLRSGGEEVGTLETAVIYLVRTPDMPVLFSWWAELDGPIAFAPDGRLADAAFEASISPGGALASEVAALRALSQDPDRVPAIDVVIEPALLEQLKRMADGYERVFGDTIPAGTGAAADAQRMLEDIADAVAPQDVQATATPFSGPSIPALLDSGLGSDLDDQLLDGNRTLVDTLDVSPVASVARPPGGTLSDQALSWLANAGVTTVLADTDAVDRPVQPNQYAPPPTASIVTPKGEHLSLVLPDPSTQSLLERPDVLADPVRAAQAVLGELAVIWREQPVPADQPDGTPTVRGLALGLASTLPAELWDELVPRLADAPFLRPVHAQELVGQVRPPGPEASLREPSTTTFTFAYADTIRELRRDTKVYASMLTQQSPVPERLRRNLYYAESATYLPPNESVGQPWIDQVAQTTNEAFGRTTPQISQVFTLTSEEGSIPLRMGDPGSTPLQVTVQLQSSQLDFPGGDQQLVVLERANQIVTFDVVAKAFGPNPARVRVVTPSGRVISEQRLIVRSTALNRWALLITGAAALMLCGLWIRRWFRRRQAVAA